jgi:transcriptional regulator with XRE-family HTH domain
MEELGEYLKSERKKLRLTLRDVEDETGVSNPYLSQIENGKIKNPSANILYKLSKVYSLPLNDILVRAKIIDEKDTNESFDFIEAISVITSNFNEKQKQEVLRFVEYIKCRKK